MMTKSLFSRHVMVGCSRLAGSRTIGVIDVSPIGWILLGKWLIVRVPVLQDWIARLTVFGV